MFLSMHNWMRAEPNELTIRRLAKFGYDSIEISGEPEMYNAAKSQTVAGQRRTLLGLGHVNVRGPRPYSRRSRGARALVKYVKEILLTMVKELDGREMTVVPSQVGKVVPMDTPGAGMAVGGGGSARTVHAQRKAGVVLGLDPLNRFETNFLIATTRHWRWPRTSAPTCGVVLDCFHINIEEVRSLSGYSEHWQETGGLPRGRPQWYPAAARAITIGPAPSRRGSGRLQECADRRIRCDAGSHAGESLPRCSGDDGRSRSSRLNN